MRLALITRRSPTAWLLVLLLATGASQALAQTLGQGDGSGGASPSGAAPGSVVVNPASGTRYVMLKRGIASHYGRGDVFHGRPTANAETFDRNGLTCAMIGVPLSRPVRRGGNVRGTGQVWVRVVWEGEDAPRRNGRPPEIFVRVTDRGPYEFRTVTDRRGRRRRRPVPHSTRVIDLSSGAMETLVGSAPGGGPAKGLIPVSVWLVRSAP